MQRDLIRQQLKTLTKELNTIFDLAREDYGTEGEARKKYNMGVMVGIGYANEKLKEIVGDATLLHPEGDES